MKLIDLKKLGNYRYLLKQLIWKNNLSRNERNIESGYRQ